MKKCSYINCSHLHETKEMADDEGVLDGGRYYHPDCLEEKKAKLEIIDVFSKRCNPDVVYASLQRTIKIIVVERNFPAKKLLWGLNWCIDHGWHLRYPQGLFKVAENMEWKEEYEKEMKKQIAIPDVDIVDDTPIDEEFVYRPKKQWRFDDILY